MYFSTTFLAAISTGLGVDAGSIALSLLKPLQIPENKQSLHANGPGVEEDGPEELEFEFCGDLPEFFYLILSTVTWSVNMDRLMIDYWVLTTRHSQHPGITLELPTPVPAAAAAAATMALSPVVTATQSTDGTSIRAIGSPYKNLASGTNSSSNGTPKPAPPTSVPQLPPTLDVAEQMNEEEKRKYVKGKKLGEGTYAIVFLGHLKSNPAKQVAIKKIKVQKEYTEGMAPDAVRELKHLQELSHPNIISLLAVFSSKDQNLNLVLEFLPLGDLEMLIRDTEHVRYGAADIKAWMGMLTRAVWFCHASFVLHRDIKPNNLLIAADGAVKLADFGLARSFADPHHNMTSNVITRWYRPPELLFGAKHYSGAVDVWSVGAVFAELILRAPYMPGNNELDQVRLICEQIGTPTEDNWPGVTRLPEYTVPAQHPVHAKDWYLARFGTVGADGVDLLVKTLLLDPKKRITAREMLDHPWWHSDPKPTRTVDLPRKGGDGAEAQVGADLKRRPGVVDEDRGGKVARKLDFGQKK
ncbi:serine/threonine-protein kinase [Cordyceps militaris CM01]|uniref:Serine/threonine-protein kinase n=1 Tax=Cordyceps militaris (strain CM01) TaxID=983644 RepID=G3JD52_CORMM|nr:serine/threonine-protein kinase [Cordyceps militaris CM01]EGX92527.1 serine/threonine-protein kinase [Cordyceps militaris CM01]